MPKITAEIPNELARQVERMVRDGWFPDQEEVVRRALAEMIEAKTFIGDSPRMLQRFAADALNDSKPEVALKFASRGLALLAGEKRTDYTLYQQLVELRVQILLVLDRAAEASAFLEEAREKLPNNPVIAKWIEKLGRTKAGSER